MIVICDLIYLGQFDYNTQTTNYSIYIRDHICWHPLYQQNRILIVLKLPSQRWLPMSAGLKRSSSTARSPWPWPSSTRPTSLPSSIDKPIFMMDAEIRSMIFHQQFYLRFSFLICLSACLFVCLFVINGSNEFTLEHRHTYFQDGCGDLFNAMMYRRQFHLKFSFLMSLCLSISLIVCLSLSEYQSLCLNVFMSFCLFVWISECFSVILSVIVSTYIFMCFFLSHCHILKHRVVFILASNLF